jgi:hypothetical protein
MPKCLPVLAAVTGMILTPIGGLCGIRSAISGEAEPDLISRRQFTRFDFCPLAFDCLLRDRVAIWRGEKPLHH